MAGLNPAGISRDAMEAKRDGFAFHSVAAERSEDSETRETFTRLVDEERKRYEALQERYRGAAERGIHRPGRVREETRRSLGSSPRISCGGSMGHTRRCRPCRSGSFWRGSPTSSIRDRRQSDLPAIPRAGRVGERPLPAPLWPGRGRQRGVSERQPLLAGQWVSPRTCGDRADCRRASTSKLRLREMAQISHAAGSGVGTRGWATNGKLS